MQTRPPDDSYDLNRFLEAQARDYERALVEIRGGRKRSHWMWYVFPQFNGLGHSSVSKHYAIKSVAEAEAYLQHPVLGARLIESARAVIDVAARSAAEMFGSPDDLKLRSCATLFARVSPAGSVFHELLDRYFGGEPDEQTLHLIGEPDSNRDARVTLQADDARAIALAAAIHHGQGEVLERQLREDAELATARIVDRRGVSRTLLHLVADWPGHFPNGPQTVAILAAAGADVNARVAHADPTGSPETPLHWAASSNDVAVLDALLDADADIEATGGVLTGGTPLADAVIFAQWDTARRLVERGAVATIWQGAALGLLDRVRDLCARDPRPSVDAITNALWHACRGGQRQTVEHLLERGADLNWVGHEEKTPCDVAAESDDHGLVEWLLARGAKRAAELA